MLIIRDDGDGDICENAAGMSLPGHVEGLGSHEF